MTDFALSRRRYLAGVASIPPAGFIAGCMGLSDWDFETEVEWEAGDNLEEFVGDVREGEEIDLEVEVDRGTAVRFRLMNRDTNATVLSRTIFRHDDIPGYSNPVDEEVVSPWEYTHEVDSRGEYYVYAIAIGAGEVHGHIRFRVSD